MQRILIWKFKGKPFERWIFMHLFFCFFFITHSIVLIFFRFITSIKTLWILFFFVITRILFLCPYIIASTRFAIFRNLILVFTCYLLNILFSRFRNNSVLVDRIFPKVISNRISTILLEGFQKFGAGAWAICGYTIFYDQVLLFTNTNLLQDLHSFLVTFNHPYLSFNSQISQFTIDFRIVILNNRLVKLLMKSE